MNMLPNEAIDFIKKITPLIENTENEVILCVPYIDLFYVLLMSQDTNIKIGAQNMHWETNGAYTGEISAEMLKSLNVEYVIIGHSERRQYFKETDETVNKKLAKAIQVGLKPIVCVGENLEERENGETENIVTTQVLKAFDGMNGEDIKKTIIAYEPVWAIGTGKTATVEEANDTIKTIRKVIEAKYGKDVAEDVVILYGGSVKSSNAKELFTASDIDGGLIGGASLNTDEFAEIVNFQ